jgi:hypothetical protein
MRGSAARCNWISRRSPGTRTGMNGKLSGMLHTVEARLAQAHAGELGHLEFLQVLCHDEITRRRRRQRTVS